MRLEDGFSIELVAAEPLVADPVAIEIDEFGRLYVVEMPGYPLDTGSSGRIKLLTDTDGDYHADHAIVFADSLRLPTGIMRWKRGVIEKTRYRGMTEDVPTVDFSGWILFCSEDMDEELAYLTIAALDEQKGEIEALFPQPHAALTGPVDLSWIGSNVPVPLHPGAEKYYREKGYL